MTASIVSFKAFKHFFLFLLMASGMFACSGKAEDDYLYLVTDPNDLESYGYANAKGEIIIPTGKYGVCYTDTLKSFAVVLKDRAGFLGIDRNEKVLFEVYPFGNGPDYPQEGLFRIIEDDKIGYANMDGEIVIKPQYDCAYSFENGKAKVSLNCSELLDREHIVWDAKEWFYIDHTGKKID